MKNKTVLVLFIALSATMLVFTGCGNKENDAVPVVAEAVEDVKETESDEGDEDTTPIEETTGNENGECNEAGEGVEVDGEIVEGTTLTQEQIEALKADATSSGDQYSLTIYEEVTKNGTYTDEYGRTFNKVVGKPDGSWRRMTDAEAQAILDQGKGAEGYYAAEAELESSSSIWFCIGVNRVNMDTVYYDYYAWEEDAKANPLPKKEIKILTPETDPELYRALKGLD